MHRYLRMFSLLLLQHALAPGNIDAHARSRLPLNPSGNPTTDVESRPYLRIAGILPLRIKSAPPPPDLITKPAAGAPPQPAASAPATATTSPSVQPVAESAGQPPAKPALPDPAPLVPPAPTNTTPPPSILPDDTRTSTRPEDFLPFFQFPDANHDVTVVVPVTAVRPPAPGQQPPSSASYQQK